MEDKFSFWNGYPEIKTDVITVNKQTLKYFKKLDGPIKQALIDTFSVPGKMLRPAFLLLFGKFGPQYSKNKKNLINLAVSIEMLHNATLIHDDIIDESNMRHGRPSIQYKYGKHIAVYAGDYLFAVSLTLLSENTKNLTSVEFNGKTMQKILLGETEQYNNAYNIEITEKQYLNQIKGKTSVLFGLACFLGAYDSGISLHKALKAKKFGEQLGMAFQLQDDILDYTTTSQELKKPVLLDVRDGIYSGPLIFALQNDETGKLHHLLKLKDDLSQKELQKISRLVHQSNGVERAKELADYYTQKALSNLNKTWPDTENREQIKTITELLLNRKY